MEDTGKMPSWRPQFIFEDSPTCLNYGNPGHRQPCSDCVLMQLVPKEFRRERVPCRHIPLNERSETIQSLYRSGTPRELEAAVGEWLMNAIQKLELERTPGPPELDRSSKRSVGDA